MEKTARVLIECSDAKGLVYKISKAFFEYELNIDNNQEFVDKESGKFFMRSVVRGNFDLELLENDIRDVLPENSVVQVIEPVHKKILLMATKESHALGDILIRDSDDELGAKIVGVVSNHESLGELVGRFDIPFVCVSTEQISREEHERDISAVLDKLDFDYIVLAKYMRVLTPDFLGKYKHKIINIHHSFLPAFIGANPYKQAYERGVKIIGATAHFVTDELDAGPIIAQNVIPVNHKLGWEEMQKSGKDVEKIVLSSALRLVLDDRVFVNGNKTVIL